MKKKSKRYGPKPKWFMPGNPEKYKGKYPIISRSSLETKAMHICDTNSAIVEWNSETLHIKYYDPIKQKNRTYITDLMFCVKTPDGKIQKYVVEIKMSIESNMPVRGKKKESTYLNECATYATNFAKWSATKKFCDGRGWKFVIWTENEMHIWNGK